MAESMERGAWQANERTKGGKQSSAARRGTEKLSWVLVLESVCVLQNMSDILAQHYLTVSPSLPPLPFSVDSRIRRTTSCSRSSPRLSKTPPQKLNRIERSRHCRHESTGMLPARTHLVLGEQRELRVHLVHGRVLLRSAKPTNHGRCLIWPLLDLAMDVRCG